MKKDELERLRNDFPAGTRIELVEMDDVHAPPKGTMGTIDGVDDSGNLLVSWDNGSRLNAIWGVDKVKKIENTL